MPNHLAGETSPYLLQHATNPVEWYPWGDEALDRARRENRPILLSVGYAACHWCHVMAHESFEDPATAAIMNERFVNIKVDREERPDLDAVYMQAVQAMTGHGGWPMTVFLTPDGEPFYGGTYFPPDDRHGMPAFRRVLASVADAYATRPDRVAASAASVRRIYEATAVATAPGAELPDAALAAAYEVARAHYDARHGGFDGAPKFPPTMVLDFLLRHWARTGADEARRMALDTFRHMAHGGIHDQLGGGFARYAVDAAWEIPHFEKMLYDNALLIRFGAHLWQATGDEEVRHIVEQTVAWLARDMTARSGGFYSSLDADSEGEEGKYYVWTAAAIDALLGDDAPVARAYWGVTPAGNFEGRTVLRVVTTAEAIAVQLGREPEAVRAAIERARAALLAAREQRVPPARDDKILAAWNALAARAVLDAGRAFADPSMTRLGLRAATLLRDVMTRDGRVQRVHKDGATRIPGFLEDQAAVGLAFLAAFESTLDPAWLAAARTVEQVMTDRFWSAADGAFYDTASDAEALVTRPRDVSDNAVPSGTSLAVELLLRVGDYLGDDALRARGRAVLGSLAPMIERYPLAFGHLLGDAEYAATLACHGDYCDMPSPAALDAARALAGSTSA